MSEPWRDPEKYMIAGSHVVRCHGCGERCNRTHWGDWCMDCNIARIERINRAFEKLVVVKS